MLSVYFAVFLRLFVCTLTGREWLEGTRKSKSDGILNIWLAANVFPLKTVYSTTDVKVNASLINNLFQNIVQFVFRKCIR